MKFNWKNFLVCGAILAACTAAGAERPAPTVNVTKVTGVKQSVSKKYVGNISAVDDVNLVARVSGKIELQNFQNGDMVKKGQLLFKLEDTKANKNDKLIIYMHQGCRCVFEPLLAQKGFDKYKSTEIKTPHYVVPACAVPKTSCEPNQKQ